jgi:hypothetical protein
MAFSLFRITDDITIGNVPKDVMQFCPTLNDIVTDTLGGCEKCVLLATPIVVPDIDSDILYELIRILLAAKITFNADDLNEVRDSDLAAVLEKILSSRSSKQLLDLMTLADFLCLKKSFNNISAKIWVEKYSATKSNFKELSHNIKKIILSVSSHSDIAALLAANEYLDDASREEIFRLALILQYNQEPKSDLSAEDFYNSLARISTIEKKSHSYTHTRHRRGTLLSPASWKK